MTKLARAIRNTLTNCLQLKKDESLLVIIDSTNQELGQNFYQIAQKISTNVLLVHTTALRDSDEPPAILRDLMMHVDANLVITTEQIYHSQAIKNACHHGSRILCLTNTSRSVLERTLSANLDFIVEKSNRLADLLSIGKSVRVTTKVGTELTIPISRYKAFSNTGIVSEAGMMGALPAGEASIPPIKRKAQGIIVVDGSLGALGSVDKPIELRIVDGFLKKISGGEAAQVLRSIIKKCGQGARNLAEFGIGTNPAAQITGVSNEDEKVLGTVHFAFGDASFEGGRIQKPCHVDTIIKKPTVSIDGHLILQDGQLLV
ncbi:aminopeptidase [candidate division KSB1 bacterium]|nr:aminopeptidase [candidate division KSB1 bacterium]